MKTKPFPSLFVLSPTLATGPRRRRDESVGVCTRERQTKVRTEFPAKRTEELLLDIVISYRFCYKFMRVHSAYCYFFHSL